MKKYILCLVSFIVILTLSGCGIASKQIKTQFKVNEETKIDHFLIACTGYEKETNESSVFLKVNYKITNKNAQEINMNLRNSFQISNKNGSLHNTTSSGNINFKPEETKEIQVTFNINSEADNKTDSNNNQESYLIIFYSGVATNNIGFILE